MVKICIPSYNRYFVKTLKIIPINLLQDTYIFVNNYNSDEELDEAVEIYENSNAGVKVIGLKTKGIPSARNAIIEHFPGGTHIIMLDDDVEEVLTLKPDPIMIKNTVEKMNPLEIEQFWLRAFMVCEKNNSKLWGIYPINNPFYMSQKINSRGFIIGTMFGVITGKLRFDPLLKLKEDYDFTLKHILEYKKVCRFDYITLKAGHYTNDGGCVQQRKENTGLEKECCDRIMSKYPGLLKRNPKRENEILIAI